MDERRNDLRWHSGQRVRMAAGDSIVAPGTCGTVRRVYPEANTLIVRFDSEADVCLVGGEEVEEVADESERAVGGV